MDILSLVFGYGWILLVVLALIFYKFVFRFFGIVIVPEDKVGHVIKNFVLFGKNKTLPEGRIIATLGEAGMQAKTLEPGIHFWYWPWQYSITMVSMRVVPSGQILLLSAKDGAPLEKGRVLARKVDCNNFQDGELFLKNGGRRGRQTAYLPAGTYRINTYLFDTTLVPAVTIEKDRVGIVTAFEGEPIPDNQIAGKKIEGHVNFQDADKFLDLGGHKGLQSQVILAGIYFINPWFASVEEVAMSPVEIGHAGVVISYFGEEGKDVSGKEFTHGNIVNTGQKGVWNETLNPGKYPLNTIIYKMQQVPTTNIVLNWATGKNESHNLDKQLSTITVRSKDGFTFNLDVSQIIHIPNTEAPYVIARFGSLMNLITQVLEPTIGNYFRNSAQQFDAIDFLVNRSARQKEAKELIKSVLDEYNVIAVDTLIGDINPPAELMEALKQRKLADEYKTTFNAQRDSETVRQDLQKQRTIADMTQSVIESEQQIIIAEKSAQAEIKKAEGEAGKIKAIAEAKAFETTTMAEAESQRISKVGNSEADVILAKGKAAGESYKIQAESMGQNNFALIKMTEFIGQNQIKIMPEVLINGSSNTGSGSIDGLLGLTILDKMKGTVQTTQK